MKPNLLCSIFACLGFVALIAWRVHAMQTRETPHFEIVDDISASHPNGCGSVIDLAEEALRMKGTASGSTLTILVLGDRDTANEPWRLGTYPIPTVRKVLEGRSAKLQGEQEILRDISGKCRSFHRTTVSPIFLGVTQAVADLRAHGCKSSSHCKLFVDSDLEENVEPSITKRLNKKSGEQRISLPQVDNAGIDVVFCGVAVTDGRIRDVAVTGPQKFAARDSNRGNLLQDVWRSLFEHPELVRFEPYCPNSAQLHSPKSGRLDLDRAGGN